LPPAACVPSTGLEAPERDTIEDWQLPQDAAPPLFSELVRRVDEALAIAKSCENSVMTVGAAALDAAEQARRAAELAERASATVLDVARSRVATVLAGAPQEEGEELRDFSERADRLVARLRQLQRIPLGVPEASGVSDR
jgi:septation ring formation regulator EzrA